MAFDAVPDVISTDKLLVQRARDRVARGWCQKQSINAAGEVCIIGGLNMAMGDVDPCGQWRTQQALALRVLDVFSRVLSCPSDWTHVADWNDNPQRTQAEVLSLFDEVIAAL